MFSIGQEFSSWEAQVQCTYKNTYILDNLPMAEIVKICQSLRKVILALLYFPKLL